MADLHQDINKLSSSIRSLKEIPSKGQAFSVSSKSRGSHKESKNFSLSCIITLKFDRSKAVHFKGYVFYSFSGTISFIKSYLSLDHAKAFRI